MLKENKWYLINRYIGESQGFTDYPEEPGNYAIYIVRNYLPLKTELVYIGTASNLKNRLYRHEIKRVLLSLDYPLLSKCKIIRDKEKRMKNESDLIKRLSPRINMV